MSRALCCDLVGAGRGRLGLGEAARRMESLVVLEDKEKKLNGHQTRVKGLGSLAGKGRGGRIFFFSLPLLRMVRLGIRKCEIRFVKVKSILLSVPRWMMHEHGPLACEKWLRMRDFLKDDDEISQTMKFGGALRHAWPPPSLPPPPPRPRPLVCVMSYTM